MPVPAGGGLPVDYWSTLAEPRGPVETAAAPESGGAHEAALDLARFAALSYKPLPICEKILARSGRKVAMSSIEGDDATRSGSSTQALVAREGSRVIVAFRGTEPTAIEDWLVDADFMLEAPAPGDYVDPERGAGAEVHGGFHGALSSVIDRVGAQIGSAPQVMLCGHSLGGALAALCFARMLRQPTDELAHLTLCTFGAPRVGNRAFARAMNDRLADSADGPACAVHRFVNHRDLVPRVPPPQLGFQHFGNAHYFDRVGNLSADLEPDWARALDRIIGASEDFGAWLKGNLADHAIGAYIQRLERAAQFERRQLPSDQSLA